MERTRCDASLVQRAYACWLADLAKDDLGVMRAMADKREPARSWQSLP